MRLYDKLWKFFSFENKTTSELIEISSLIDMERNNEGLLYNKKNEFAETASLIVALMNEKSIAETGNKIYENLNDLIVTQNLMSANANNGRQLYEKLVHKQGAGKYTIRRSSKGFMFTLKSDKGEALATSELYSKIESCMNGIESLRRNSKGEIDDLTQESSSKVSNPKFEIYVDRMGEYRFRLKAKNGEIIAVSEGYKNKSACLKTIESVKKHAGSEYVEKA